jgi:hypothetical protein
MKHTLLWLVLTASAAHADIFYGLRCVETGDRWNTRPGRHGELSAYQLGVMVWAQHSKLPFSKYGRNRAEATRVAHEHIAWIRDELLRHNRDVTPYNLALAWHVGVTQFLYGHVTAGDRDFATRVANLSE